MRLEFGVVQPNILFGRTAATDNLSGINTYIFIHLFSWLTMVQMILSSSWNISPPSSQGDWLEHTNNIMLFVIILLFPKSVLPFHPISCGNFRNGVNTELAKEEFVALKMLISRMFKDKSYTSLWEMMLNRELYCSVFKVFMLFLFQSFYVKTLACTSQVYMFVCFS